ncbi:hypothetical protein LNN31_10290 [Acetobacterium wieringae]|uniref:KAP NTPase domain-containing protein n=1 Tax=Acetobacterium wieringae TaxID=52694 RepID=A0ABY6HCH4_9FIRM|nr:P-loop NTPase fold protein [Acetobacterium wieringae]UYO61174.1 hypothetical protein LNN31_10290 [Acetobacterium wieringae]VUZ29160.1 Uncharacterised protein [Acetobacterium wieringae]
MLDKYRDYFDIDPEYFPQVNEAIINDNPDIWRKFYPHETFVKLVKDAVSAISRKQKVSIWVEGAYGTGKSHAVLTLKKLLEASEEDTREYFDKYKDQLSNDLMNQFQQLKSSEQKILTVHRYGSSSIRSDGNLVSAIQDSIVRALKENNIENNACATLKDAAIKWLSMPWAKNAFNDLITSPEYVDLFSGDDVDTVINKLNSFSGDSLQELMGKIMKVGDEKQFKALTLDVDGLVEWIKDVIKVNNLKAIVFIWDEFTEYFKNNMRALTGFQKIADLSGSDPFYLIVVTHNITHIFPETDNDWKKILGRFINPICNIELPENMAFRLMGAAMEKNEDSQVQADWELTCDELYERTHDARKIVKDKARISDYELKAILPIHPYTALLLKHISSAFDSNQRSMFDFIKNDRGEDIKGFQWFIDNCGPFDENPLLTIDMLWDFFYEKGKEHLSHEIRSILDCYTFSSNKNLGKDEKRVLKTVLLLQAISQKTGDSVELFIPNEKNINKAFEGSDLEYDEAVRIVEGLIPEILFRKPMSGGKYQYSALINAGNALELDKQKAEQRKKSTSALINEGDLAAGITLNGAIRLRYVMKYVSVIDFKQTINLLRNQESSFGNKIMACVAFAKDEIESATIGKYINDAVCEGSYNIVFIDASITPLGIDLMEQYVEAMANSIVNLKQDRGLSLQYDANAKDVLKKWRCKITEGEFVVYTTEKPEGERITTLDLLYKELGAINRKRYPNGLETGNAVTDTMWQSTSLPAGVECGVKQETSGQYRSSNPQTKLENYIGSDAWQISDYWIKKPYLPISKIKLYVEEIIAVSFKKDGRVPISKIYDALKVEPYGFMSCNLTAFIIGFVLKEYADATYTWSDGLTNDIMSVSKLKEMVSEVMKHSMTPIPRYKEKFIVTMTDEEKAFNEASSRIFNISINLCSSVEQTRERIRLKMKEHSFPIWCLKFNLDKIELQTDKQKVSELIDHYSGIANNSNFGASKTESEIAFAIGKLCIGNNGLVEDMVLLNKEEKYTEGMITYLHSFEDGILVAMADEIDDGGQYINRLKKKFDADAANWVWNLDTANQKISEVVMEYQIIKASNKVLPKNIAFDATIREWCDRCKLIRISYQYAKNNWDDLSGLMELLYNIKKTGQLFEVQRQEFLDQINTNGEAFNAFYNNQIEIFKKACTFIIGQFTDDQIKEVYMKLPTDLFTADKLTYQTTVQTIVEKFVSEQGSAKLKKFWKDKTGTETPRDWSKKYLTPILCMVEDKDVQAARQAFATVAKKQPDKNSIEKAMHFFEQADFFDKLGSKVERDRAFSTSIIKSYSIMLDDVDEVRRHLDNVMTPDAYDWYGLPLIDKQLCQMAEFKYTQCGCIKALEKIDSMDIADVKRYLKDLIQDNMIVGMEIIKSN